MKPKLLIVEDESISAMNFKKCLTSFGYEVVGVAATGEDAIRKAAESKPDLVLMDIILKGDMDGIEAASIILKDYGIPVIYLTAHPEEDMVNRAKKTYPYGYIVKPTNETDLKNTVNLALYKHSTELKSKEKEAKYQDLFDSAPHYSILMDAEGKIQDVNNSLTCALNCTKKDLIGSYLWDLEMFQQGKGLFQEKIRQLLKGNPAKPFEYKYNGENNDEKWSSLQLTPLIIKGKLSSILCVAHDVTGMKEAEKKIRESKESLIKAQKLGKIGSFHYDFSKNVEYWSPSLYQLFKIDSNKIMTFGALFEYIIPEDQYKLRECWKKLFNERKPVTLELRLMDDHGEFKHVQINLELLSDENNQATRIMGTVQDITERKIAEKRLLMAFKRKQHLAEELKISNEELQAIKENFQVANEELLTTVEELQTANKDMMDSQISLNETISQLRLNNKELEQLPHAAFYDLQDPLSKVSIYTHILELRYKGRLDEDADEYIDSIIQSTQEIKNLIEKLKYEHMNLKNERMDLKEDNEDQ